VNPDYAALAGLYGASGYKADTPESLQAALAEAIASGKPAVIHSQINPAALSTLRNDLFSRK
jgi:acetolactate synthase-1/2/3 large subunit